MISVGSFLAGTERAEAHVAYHQATLEFLRAYHEKNADLVKRWGEQRTAAWKRLLDGGSQDRDGASDFAAVLCEIAEHIPQWQIDVSEAANQSIQAAMQWASAFTEKNSALMSRWYNEFEIRRQKFESLVERLRREC